MIKYLIRFYYTELIPENINYMTKVKKKVNGENILYHYIQKNILSTKDITPFQKQLVEHLIIDLSIWIPFNVYEKMPVLLPFVVRDASSRIKNQLTGSDEWGVSDKFGYLRDDNSLIKNIFGACPIRSKYITEYQGSFLGNGFVASHIWREVKGSKKLASTIPQTNSFVPNLVWLPKQISKLTDREKSYAQQLLQSISHHIYRKVNNDSYTQEIWNFLPNPEVECEINIETLNFFNVTNEWLERRSKKLTSEMTYILDVIENPNLEVQKIKCSRYIPTLKNNLENENRKNFIEWVSNSIERVV